MALQRENIMALIGGGRYHSAILTTFNFDFYFFEMKAMKWLRACGVRNVNVLVDGHYYAELMRQSSGEEMQLSPGYSLYPVFGKSIFHPKVWMLFGPSQGLLIVGSGNLTGSGNGSNEEIWGAFHFDTRLKDNAALFSAAWSNIQKLCATVKGFTHEKISRWIPDECKWLNTLPAVQPAAFHPLAGTEQVVLLANTNTSTIWQQLTALTAHEKITAITILSPYYDLKGKAIQALAALFPAAKINIVIDESGMVPSALPLPKNYSFFDWYELGISKQLQAKPANRGVASKLHAKIIHLEAAKGMEYCLWGSANTTPEGLGLPGAATNTEWSLLLRAPEGKLLERLGITLKKPVDLSTFKSVPRESVFEELLSNNSYAVRLLSAEWVYGELYLYAEGDYNAELLAKIFDRENRLVFELGLGKFKIEIRVKPGRSLEGLHHIQLFDSANNTAVSNKILLADYHLLAKTHPNPRTEQIESIYNEIQGGELSRLFDLLPFAMLDEQETADTANILSTRTSRPVKVGETDQPGELYELSSYRPVGHNALEKSLLLSSLSLRVLDLLKFIGSKDFGITAQAELRIDEQEGDLDSLSGAGEKEATPGRDITLQALKLERKKLLAYFDKLYDQQQYLMYPIVRPEPYRLTLTDLAKYLIALELLQQFGGKTARYVENSCEHFFGYLDFNGEAPYFNNSVKGCCLNLIGDFIRLARSGFKVYELEYTKAKMEQLKRDALIGSVACILNMKWKEPEMIYFNTLLLNCLHYLGERDPGPALLTAITARIGTLKNSLPVLKDNFALFEQKIIPAFKRTIRQLVLGQFENSSAKGGILYKSPWGYCYVKDITAANRFTLIRPGFLWDNSSEDFVKHTDDEVYHPVPLINFINVDI